MPSPPTTDADALHSAQSALRAVCLALPHLSGLAHEVRLQIEPRCETAGVFASGRLVVNPYWWLALSPPEAMFVMAHELMHLALDSHGRQGTEDPWLVNVAHDYIINDMLVKELNMLPPADGLWFYGASQHSLEWWVGELRSDLAKGYYVPDRSFGPSRKPEKLGALGSVFDKALSASRPPAAEPDLRGSIPVGQGDVLSNELEGEWYPGEPTEGLERQRTLIHITSTKAASLGASRGKLSRVWQDYNTLIRIAGDESACFEAVSTAYRPPWERALQRWFDGTCHAFRSYARASRRGSDRTDGVVLAGRRREGFTLHLILDTSGSMYHLLSDMLGTISSFAEANHVEEIHLIQADGHDPIDQWLPVTDLRSVELRGLGDGSLVAPLLHMAADPQIEAVVVVTDGAEPYPADAPACQVLWALPKPSPWFDPGYGTIIVMDLE